MKHDVVAGASVHLCEAWFCVHCLWREDDDDGGDDGDDDDDDNADDDVYTHVRVKTFTIFCFASKPSQAPSGW